MRRAVQPCQQAAVSEAHQVWSAVVASAGFGKSFPHWVVTQAHIPWQDYPSIEQVSRMKSAVMTFANCSADAWQHKQLSFNEQVEKVMACRGWFLAFSFG